MSGQSRIIARVAAITYSSSNADAQAEFVVDYHSTGQVSGGLTGQVVLVADATQNEAQIKNELCTLLAAHVNAQVQPDQGYTKSDVRGLNV